MNTNTKTHPLIIVLVIILLVSCEASKTDKFPMEKPFWGVDDYKAAISELQFNTPQDEKYPMLSDPETSPVFKKLVDRKNISSVMEDNSLGLRHRADFSSEMFSQFRQLTDLYNAMDREDKFIYDQELIELLRFGLYLQIQYFKIGNDKILLEADNADQVNYIIKENEETIISNFNNYLDNINREKSFSDYALKNFADGIGESFSDLMKTFPNGNYSGMLSKATDMEKKANNPDVKHAISNLVTTLKTKVGVTNDSETNPEPQE